MINCRRERAHRRHPRPHAGDPQTQEQINDSSPQHPHRPPAGTARPGRHTPRPVVQRRARAETPRPPPARPARPVAVAAMFLGLAADPTPPRRARAASPEYSTFPTSRPRQGQTSPRLKPASSNGWSGLGWPWRRCRRHWSSGLYRGCCKAPHQNEADLKVFTVGVELNNTTYNNAQTTTPHTGLRPNP